MTEYSDQRFLFRTGAIRPGFVFAKPTEPNPLFTDFIQIPNDMNFEVKTQLSVAIENTPGAIARLTNILAAHDVSLNALTVSEHQSEGKFRFTACDPVAAKRSLESNGYTVGVDEVLSIRLQDSRGKLAFLTKAFSESGINIDYMYASVDEEGAGSRLILKVSNVHLATHVLSEILVAA